MGSKDNLHADTFVYDITNTNNKCGSNSIILKKSLYCNFDQNGISLIILSDREQYFDNNGRKSEMKSMSHNTLQGSVLGPIVFNINAYWRFVSKIGMAFCLHYYN